MNPQEVIDLYKLTVESTFIPWSKSRNAGEKTPSLNWKVTLKQDGRVIVTTLYSAGCGHCPSYEQHETYDSRIAVKEECERGFAVYGTMGQVNKHRPILPDAKDVIYSLMMDSEVSDFDSFEDWADAFGYDHDSRSAEKIYRACLEIASQFNGRLSSTVRDALRDAYQDY